MFFYQECPWQANLNKLFVNSVLATRSSEGNGNCSERAKRLPFDYNPYRYAVYNRDYSQSATTRTIPFPKRGN